jgi:hypothetical protein
VGVASGSSRAALLCAVATAVALHGGPVAAQDPSPAASPSATTSEAPLASPDPGSLPCLAYASVSTVGCQAVGGDLRAVARPLAKVFGNLPTFSWPDPTGDGSGVDPTSRPQKSPAYADITGTFWTAPFDLSADAITAFTARFGRGKPGAFWGADTTLAPGPYRLVGITLAGKPPPSAPASGFLIVTLATDTDGVAGGDWPASLTWRDPWQGAQRIVEGGWFPAPKGVTAGLGQTDLALPAADGSVDRYNIPPDSVLTMLAHSPVAVFLVPAAEVGPSFRVSTLWSGNSKHQPALDWAAAPEGPFAQLPSSGTVPGDVTCASLSVTHALTGSFAQPSELSVTIFSPLFGSPDVAASVDATLTGSAGPVSFVSVPTFNVTSATHGDGRSFVLDIASYGDLRLTALDFPGLGVDLYPEVGRVMGSALTVDAGAGVVLGDPGCVGDPATP